MDKTLSSPDVPRPNHGPGPKTSRNQSCLPGESGGRGTEEKMTDRGRRRITNSLLPRTGANNPRVRGFQESRATGRPETARVGKKKISSGKQSTKRGKIEGKKIGRKRGVTPCRTPLENKKGPELQRTKTGPLTKIEPNSWSARGASEIRAAVRVHGKMPNGQRKHKTCPHNKEKMTREKNFAYSRREMMCKPL